MPTATTTGATANTPTTIWLHLPTPTAGAANPIGQEFWNLFNDPASWEAVAQAMAGQAGGIVVSLGFIVSATNAQLTEMIDFLNANHLQLMVYTGVVPIQANGVGQNQEGFVNPALLSQAAQRIQSLGGTINAIGMDEPLFAGYESATGPQLSISALAQQVASTVSLVKAVFPDVQFSDDDGPATTGVLGQWAQAFQQAVGSPISQFNCDMDWSTANWQTSLAAYAAAVRATGAIFGIIGDAGAQTSNVAWTVAAEANIAAAAADPAIAPTEVEVTSWDVYPTVALPEGEDGSLSHVAAEASQILPLYDAGYLVGGAGVTVSTVVPTPSYVGSGADAVMGVAIAIPGVQIVQSASPGSAGMTYAVVVTDVSGTLSATASGAGTVSSASPDVLTLTGSLADINAELASLAYTGAAVGTDTIDITTYDGVGLVDDNEVTVDIAAPITVSLPSGVGIAALYQNIFGVTPSAAAMAAAQAALASGQTLAQVAAPWIAQGQVTISALCEQVQGASPTAAALTQLTEALVAGESIAQIRTALAAAGTVQSELSAIYQSANGVPVTASQLASLTGLLASGTNLNALEAPLLANSPAEATITALYQQVEGQAPDASDLQTQARALLTGTPLTTIQIELATSQLVQNGLALLYNYTYDQAPTAAQLAPYVTELEGTTSWTQVAQQFTLAAQAEVTADYQQVLGRNPQPNELITNAEFLTSGVQTNSQILTSLAFSVKNAVTVTDTVLSGGAVTLYDEASYDNVVSAAGDTSASKGKSLTFVGGPGPDSFTGGFENDVVFVTAAAVGGDVLTGGSGTNTLNLTSAGSINLSGVSEFGAIGLFTGNNTITLTDKTLSGGAVIVYDGASGNNTFSAAGDTTASKGKTLNYVAGSGTDTFTGGFENDIVHVAAAAVGGDTLTGGSGTNTLSLSSAGSINLSGVSEFAAINLASGNSTVTLTDTTLSGGAVIVYDDAASGNNTLSAAGDTTASKGKTLTYVAGSGTDTFTGGFENDIVHVAAAAVGGDTLTGGSGTNTLSLTSAGSINLSGVSEFAAINLASGNNTVTLTDTTLSGGTVVLHAAAGGNNVISAAADTSASKGKTLIYFAGTGADGFTGGFENDTVDVTAAAVGGDTLTGGSGSNTLALISAGSVNLGGISKFTTITLAAGNNTATLTDTTFSGGTVVLHAGASGNDSVSAAGDTSASKGKTFNYWAGTATDSFTGGFENDTVNVSAAAVGGDTLVGGSGTNTLNLTSAGSVNLGGVSKFGTINLATGNSTVTLTDKTLSGGAVAVYDGASGNNSVSAAGDTAASVGKSLTYYAGAGTDSFTGGFENDTVDVTAAAVGGDTLTGGSGSNTLALISAGSVNLRGVSKFAAINLASGNNTVTLTDTTFSGGTVVVHAGASGNDSVSAAGDTSASKGKTFNYWAGTATDSFTGGFENDTVNVSAAAVGGDTLTGGSGTNTLNLTSAGSVNLRGVSKFGTINLATGNSTVTLTDKTLSGGAVAVYDGASGNNSVSAAGDTAASVGKSLTYYAGAGTDSFTGGFENDTVDVTAAAVGGDTLTGGSGSNALAFTSAGSVNLRGVSKFAAINLASGNNTVTLTDTTLSGGAVTVYDGASGNDSVSVAGDSSASIGKSLTYYAGSGTDTFIGGFENDTINVTAAVVGGDTLTGGSGTNTLSLSSAGSINLSGVSEFGAINLATGNSTVSLTDKTLSGGAVAVYDGASGNNSVSAAGDTAASVGKSLTYYAGAGTDSFTGGFENDTVDVTAAAVGGDTLTGGSGSNALALISAGSVNLRGVSKFAAITLTSGNNTVTLTDTTLSGGTVVLHAAAGGNNIISAAGDTSASKGKSLTFVGGPGPDSFTGGFENDVVFVTAAAVGGDVLTGGSGTNTLNLTSAGSINLSGVSEFGAIGLFTGNNTITLTDKTLSGGAVIVYDGASGNNTFSAAGDTTASKGKTLNYVAGSGTDTFTGGFENDIVHVAAAAVGGDTLTGGSGTNTLSLSSAGSINLSGVSEFAAINLASGNSTVTLTDTTLSGGAVIVYDDAASGNNTLSAAGDTTASKGKTLTYVAGSGTDTFTGGFENDIVHVAAAAVGGDTLTGGSGTNTLSLTSAGSINLSGVSEFAAINLASGNNTVTLTDTTLSGGTVVLHAAAGGNNVISAAADTSASKGKTLIYFAGTGADGFTGGFENDTVDVTAAAVGGDTLTGGSGSNTLALISAGSVNLGGISKFTTITLAAGNNTATLTDTTFSGGTVVLHAGASGNDSVSAAGDTSASKGKTFNYWAGTATDSFTGGFENDTVNVSAAAVGGDTLVGGSGTNTLNLTSAGSVNLGGVSKFGTINLATGNSTVTLTDKTLSGGAVAVYDGASGNNSVSAAGDTAASVGKSLTYYAGAGTDSFTGGFENDTIYAGTGLGTYTAGSGNDTFVFITDNLTTQTLNSFHPSLDDLLVYGIHASNGFDLGITDNGLNPTTPTAITPGDFIANASGNFTSSGQRFAYDTSDGHLFYSATGSNNSESLVATLTGAPAITATNMLFEH